jgi:penicillin-binding protein 1A
MINLKNIKRILNLGFYSFIFFFVFMILLILYYGRTLPNYKKLISYEPPITTRMYAANGALIGEFATEKRSYVKIKFIPDHVKNAFIAAEDSNFYNHPGIDVKSILRASYQNIFRIKEGKNFIGGSTITQQVVKNILLTKERTISRKIKEAILSIRISKALSKDKVLELYLNEIYLGYRSYGVAAASLNYFSKPLSDLTISEASFLASLPKAPGALDPKKNYSKALTRRNWVIQRMIQDGFISNSEAELATSTPIILRPKKENIVKAGSFSETIRKEMVELYGENFFNEEGLVIHTTLDPKLQKIAAKALVRGLKRYDFRHSYRGPIKKLEFSSSEEENRNLCFDELDKITRPDKILNENWDLACVINITNKTATILFEDSTQGKIKLRSLRWVTKTQETQDPTTGEITDKKISIEKISEALNKGYVIWTEKRRKSLDNEYFLRQIAEVNGSVVILNPHNGAVLAMVGGYSDKKTEFNRAVQAMRQPGSIMKPFTYLTALEKNYPPNTIVIDDEIRMKKEDGSYWIPMNYSKKFYGPTTIRTGLERSRNVVTVRLAEMVGLSSVATLIKKFDINEDPLSNYSMILGADETNLLKITNAYAMIANGGKKINPYYVEKIQDKNGKLFFKADKRKCQFCNFSSEVKAFEIKTPVIESTSRQLVKETSAYQMTSLLTGVVQRGTGWRAKKLKKPIAGKTGTTNDSFDAWFVGFSPDLVIGVYVGFDKPRSLGENESGSSAAVPIFVDIMKKHQRKINPRPFKVPKGVKFSKIDKTNGQRPGPSTLEKNIIYEVFKDENFKKIFSKPKVKEEENYETNIY